MKHRRGRRAAVVTAIALAASLTGIAGAEARPRAHDFDREAALLYRVAACGGNARVAHRRARVVARHCRQLRQTITEFRERYLARARPFFAGIVPRHVPRTVVYPFGGSDLLAALVAYPELRELTTISLEPAGDPRAINTLSPGRLARELRHMRGAMKSMFKYNYGVTKIMRPVMTKSHLPVHAMFALTALSVHGYEPVSLRYFRLRRDGTVHYVSARELARAGKRQRWHKRHLRLFDNMELRFRRAGQRRARIRTYRHLRANINDYHLKRDDRVLRHLRAKGRVAAIAKASNYMYWWSSMRLIRDYMLEHMTFMISDASGIRERDARRAGFVQRVWGRFAGAHVQVNKRYERERKRQFKRHAYRPAPVRFGYPDIRARANVMVTERRARATTRSRR